MKIPYLLLILPMLYWTGCNVEVSQEKEAAKTLPTQLYQYTDQLEPGWSSFENIDAGKGQGGKENFGAKGHPYNKIKAGETKSLLKVDGPGIVNRMWITISDRSPRLRA